MNIKALFVSLKLYFLFTECECECHKSAGAQY